MRIFLTGATGLLGRRLVVDRLSRGDRLVVLSRDGARARTLFAAHVNPNIDVVDGNVAHPGPWQKAVNNCDAVIHLAGAGIADHRWSNSYKKELINSRVDSTHQIVSAIADATRKPSVLISASAVGYYGDAGDTFIDETQPAGNDFLAELCVRWEDQAQLAERDGVRVVRLRTAMTLDNRGGALKQLIMPYRFFLGGPIGIRPYWVSWIHWRDWVELVEFALKRNISGPLNMTSPNPITNWELARQIGGVLGRPWIFAVPKPILRVIMGEAAKYISMSQRVIPRRALDSGFSFVYGQIESAMESLLGENPQANAAPISRAQAITANGAPQPTVETTIRDAPPQRVRLIAIDVEGALLRSDNTIFPEVVQACRRAQQAGCVVVLASGRPPQALRNVLQEIGISAPVITYHGALIWNPIDWVAQYHEALDGAVAKDIITCARAIEPNLYITIDVLDHWFTDRVDDSLLRETSILTAPDDVGPIDPHLTGKITRLSLLGEPDQLERVLPAVKQQFWMTRAVAMYQLNPRRVQLLHPHADKSIALQRVAARLGARRAEVMAIGEALNDAGMVEWAGFGVAVGNACEKVKHLADVTVASNDDAGVAEAIERFVLDASPLAAAAPSSL